MPDFQKFDPYRKASPGDIVSAERDNEVQQIIRAEIADLADKEAHDISDVNAKFDHVDAEMLAGKSFDQLQAGFDARYIKRDDVQAAGQYRRYFKQITEQLKDNTFEPAVIEHKLCRFPVVEVFELMQLFPDSLITTWQTTPPKGVGAMDTWPFDPKTTKFLVYYATNRDQFAEPMHTESGERFNWGDPLTLYLDEFGLKPTATQKLDDVLNDFWGKMFNTGEENDDFASDAYGVTPYVQNWIDKDRSVDDLVKGGQWGDLRIAIRPRLLSPANPPAAANAAPPRDLQVYHLNQNYLELRANDKYDLMVILRT